MIKSMLAAATFAALAFGVAGTASAAPVLEKASGIHSASLVQNAGWHRRRHCAWRHHRRVCWWR
jgi:hypothetical protein